MTTAKPEDSTVEESNCVHHWLIERPSGEQSLGVCKRCGAVRQFSNGNAPKPTWIHSK